jgi:sulfatase modifying factor 1
MENMLRRSGTSCILFIIMLILSTLLPAPILAVEKVFRNSLGMEFVLIPAGTFMMGSPPEEAYRGKEVQHQVTISSPFYLQSTEVTVEQWRAVMGRKLFGRRMGPGDMPVVKISWHDCMDFIRKLNALSEWSYRLPTEA